MCSAFALILLRLSAQGLALTPDDAWAVHSIAHVYEMKAEVDKGLKFMESTEKDWQVLVLFLPKCVCVFMKEILLATMFCPAGAMKCNYTLK